MQIGGVLVWEIIEESSQMTNVCVYNIYLNLPLHGISHEFLSTIKKKNSSVPLAPTTITLTKHHPPSTLARKNPLIGPGKGPKNVTFKRIRRLTVEVQGPSRLAERLVVAEEGGRFFNKQMGLKQNGERLMESQGKLLGMHHVGWCICLWKVKG